MHTAISRDYLSWAKNLDHEIDHNRSRTLCFNFAGSSVQAPADVVSQHIAAGSATHLLDTPNPWGNAALKEHIAKRYIANGNTDRVLVTTGASNALYLVCQALLSNGAHVIVEYPTYEPFLAVADSLGATISLLIRRPEEDYQIMPADVQALVTPQTKLIILSNLHNPSGAYLSDNDLYSVLEAARQSNSQVRILVDEVFHDLSDEPSLPAAMLDDCFISINSLSKSYGLSLLRCGWILASSEMINLFRTAYILVENIGSRLTESIAAVSFQHIDEHAQYSRSLISRNRDIAKQFADSLRCEGIIEGYFPDQGCLFFPRILSVADANDMVQLIERLKHQHIFVVPGSFFGAPSHMRIGFGGGASTTLDTGLQLLAASIRTWHQDAR